MKKICEVCGALEQEGMPFLRRVPLDVCPDCYGHARRSNSETGCMIESRDGSWVDITRTFVSPRVRSTGETVPQGMAWYARKAGW
jgi:hypothetical protein